MKHTDRMTRKTRWLVVIAVVITIATSTLHLNHDRSTVTATTILIATPHLRDRSLQRSDTTYTANGQYDLTILSQTNPETQTREDFRITPTAGLPLIESPNRTLACDAKFDPDCTMSDTTYNQIYAIVRQIPPGRVTTYGRVAELAGLAGKARLVGYALFQIATDDAEIPWQRVINAKGEISHSVLREGSDYLQRALLEAEGVTFDDRDRIDLKRYGWPEATPYTKSGSV